MLNSHGDSNSMVRERWFVYGCDTRRRGGVKMWKCFVFISIIVISFEWSEMMFSTPQRLTTHSFYDENMLMTWKEFGGHGVEQKFLHIVHVVENLYVAYVHLLQVENSKYWGTFSMLFRLIKNIRNGQNISWKYQNLCVKRFQNLKISWAHRHNFSEK